MKSLTIYGAGAVGGFLLCKLAKQDKYKLTVVSRKESLAQIQSKGHIKLVSPADGETIVADQFDLVDAAETGSVGHQDYIICCVKGNGLAEALPSILPMVGPDTCLITLQNGLPFWHNCAVRHPALSGKPVRAVDPDGELLAAFQPYQLAGCVAYIAVERLEPSVIRLNYACSLSHFHFGEALRGPSPRLDALVQLFRDAGIPAFMEEDIHSRIWNKLLVSTSINTTNLLTGGTCYDLIHDPAMRAVVRNILEEVQQVGSKLDVSFERSAEDEVQALQTRLTKSKFSMLQDAEAGRELEISPYITAVLEIAEALDVKMPVFSMISALVLHWAQNHPPRTS